MFIETIENRQGLKVACLEEIAFRKGYIGESELEKAAHQYGKSGYGRYLKMILENKHQFIGID